MHFGLKKLLSWWNFEDFWIKNRNDLGLFHVLDCWSLWTYTQSEDKLLAGSCRVCSYADVMGWLVTRYILPCQFLLGISSNWFLLAWISFNAHFLYVVCVAGWCHQTTEGYPQRAAVDHWSTCSERPLWSLTINMLDCRYLYQLNSLKTIKWTAVHITCADKLNWIFKCWLLTLCNSQKLVHDINAIYDLLALLKLSRIGNAYTFANYTEYCSKFGNKFTVFCFSVIWLRSFHNWVRASHVK